MKTVIVTGASKGIGAALCRTLRSRGVRVIGVARSQDLLSRLAAEKIGPGTMDYLAGDVSDAKVASAAVRLALQGGTLDGLVLNAGSLGPVGKMADIPIDQYREATEVNTISALTWIQAAIPSLRSTKGKIIAISTGVSTNPNAGFAAYCASKASLNTLMNVLAQEEPDITTLSVAPGIVDTEMFASYFEKGKPFMGAQNVAFLEKVIKDKKALTPEIVADALATLTLQAPKSKSGQFINWNDKWIQEL